MESVFSVMGCVHSRRRPRLTNKHAKMLAYLNVNRRMLKACSVDFGTYVEELEAAKDAAYEIDDDDDMQQTVVIDDEDGDAADDE